MFLDKAKSTFGKYCHKAGKTRQTKLIVKPWFDLDCKFARQNYRKLKKNFPYMQDENKQTNVPRF
jgi:hypothetical protein